MSATPPILLVGIASELAALDGHIDRQARERQAWGWLIQGRWKAGQVPVAVATVGIGKVGAAMGTQGAIDAVHPRLVLNCGSAGALAPGLLIGDLLLASQVIAHDQGIFLPTGQGQGPDGFVYHGSPLPAGRRRAFVSEPGLLMLAQRTARQGSLSLRTGPVVTGDQVIFQDERKAWLHQHFGALAVENEGAAVAQVAHCHGLPWLVIRAISDQADGAAAFDYRPLLRFDEDDPRPEGRLDRWRRLARAGREARRRLQRFRQGQDAAMASVAAFLDALLPALHDLPPG